MPIPAVLSVVVRDGRLLLVRRANPPDRGRWVFPGGRIEAGEEVVAAALRELHEETGVIADGGTVLTVLDSIHRDETGVLTHHFVLVAVLCRWVSGEGRAADDALEAAWLAPEEIAALHEKASRNAAWLADLAVARSACCDRVGRPA